MTKKFMYDINLCQNMAYGTDMYLIYQDKYIPNLSHISISRTNKNAIKYYTITCNLACLI